LGFRRKKINCYKIKEKSQSLANLQKSLYELLKESRAKNRLFLAKQFEILCFQYFKFSRKNSKKINGYKIRNNSPAFATIKKESLWTLEGIQCKKPLVSSQTM
jgi:hypothetical protein